MNGKWMGNGEMLYIFIEVDLWLILFLRVKLVGGGVCANPRIYYILLGVADSKTRSSHTCYRTKFGRSRTNCKDVGRGSKNWGCCAYPVETSFSLCYCAEFRHSRSNHTSVFTEIHETNFTPCLLFRSLSQLNWHRLATYDFLLAVQSNLSRAVFEIIGDFGRKSQFSHPSVFNAPLREFTWNFVMTVVFKN